MPDLSFTITGVDAAQQGITPLLEFSVRTANANKSEPIESVLLQAQIQIQSLRRSYTPREKAGLVELFGPPEDWGRTLRNRFWAHAQTIVPQFVHNTEVRLSVPCTYDLNVATTKYFHALNTGNVELLFLFSGTVFYPNEEESLQVQRISWDKEAAYTMPVAVWKEMMERHYPNAAWLYLRRDIVDRLGSFKRDQGLTSWEQTIEHLLTLQENQESIA